MMQNKVKSLGCALIFLMIIVALVAFSACSTGTTLSKISVSGAKIEFSYNEDFSLGNAVVSASYSDGSKKTLTEGDYVVDYSAYDKTQAGTYSIIIEHGGKQTSYDVTVMIEVTSITISGMKTEFDWGEEFSTSGLVATKVYADGSTEVCSNAELVINSLSYNKNKAGSYSIIVGVRGTTATTSYSVTVSQPQITGLELSNAKTNFNWGEDFSAGDLVVKAVLQDGSKTAIESGFTVDSSLYNKNKSAQYVITVSYEGFTQDYTVNVFAPKVSGIRVESLQDNYRWGTAFLSSKIEVYKIYQDGSEVKASSSEYTIDSSEYNANQEGAYNIVVKLNNTEYQDSVSVFVNAPHVSKIKVSNHKTQYDWGEEFEFVGEIKAIYVDKSEVELNDNEYTVLCEDYNKEQSGKYSVVVSYNENSTIKITYTITVKEPKIKSLNITSYKKEYTLYETFSPDDISGTVVREDGSEDSLTSSMITIDQGNYDDFVLGDYIMNVQLKDDPTVGAEIAISVKRAKKLRILMIGNSFSDDTSEYAPQILKNLGYEFEVGNMFIGGCSISSHYSNLLANNAKYDFRYYNGDKWDYNYGGVKQTLEYAIKFKDWDIITFQQASGDSGLSTTYGDLSWLVDSVQRRATNPNVKFFFNMTWAYQQNSTHSAFPRYDSNQITMYNAILSAVDKSVDMRVIPNGTAIQNARTTFVGDNLTRDGYHLTYDFGRYVAGLTLVGRLTCEDLSKVTFVPSNLSEEYRLAAIESATNALENPKQITNSKYTSIEEIKTQGLRKLSYEEYGWTTTGGYWNSTTNDYNKCITVENNSSDSNTHKFVATKRFTKQELPVGSVIKIESGWQYRPEAWITDAKQSSRPSNVSTTYVDVTEEWWGNYTLRAFNVTNGTVLDSDSSNPQFETAKTKLTIYVPKSALETALENARELSYEEYGWTTTGGYWNSTTNDYNKCITVENNSSDSNTHKFVATKRFTKQELPVGSVIKIESGWQYRPEAWITDAKQSSRPSNVSTTYVDVTEEWWGNYTLRAFNVTNGTSLASSTNPQFETAKTKLTIYVPKK